MGFIRITILSLFTIFFTQLLCAHPPQHIKLPLANDPEIVLANQYYEKGKALKDAARYQEAMEYFQKALKIYVKTFGEDHPDVATVYTNMGNVYIDQGDYSRAARYYQKALKIYVKTLGEDHPSVARSYTNMGSVYRDQGDYSRATEYYQKSLAIQLKTLGEDHSDVADSYNNMGLVYSDQGDYSRAAEYYQKSLAIQLKTLEEDHPNVASVYNNMGLVYSRQGDYSRAAVYFQKSLAILLKALGEDHPSVASVYNNMGIVYIRQGDYSRAAKYFQKALKIYVKTLGEDHPNVAKGYNHMGIIYKQQGDYSRAAEYCQKSLAIRLKALGEDHPSVAGSYNSMGNVYRDQGDYSRAAEYYQKSLAIRLKALGEDHPDVASVYSNMGRVYRDQGNDSRAAVYYQKALKIYVKALGENHPLVASVYSNMGLVCNDQGDYSRAAVYLQKALKIYVKVLGEGHSFVATSYNNMGSVYRDQGDYSRATEYLQKSLVILLKVFGSNHSDVAMNYNNLGLTYQAQKEYSSSILYHQKALSAAVKNFRDTANVYANPLLKEIVSKKVLLLVLRYKARTAKQLYGQTGRQKDLELAFQTARLATDLIDSMRNEHTSVETKQALSENAGEVYEGALRTAFELHRLTGNEDYLHKAFLLTEKSKSFLLLQALRDAEAKTFAGLPDSLLEQERDLKISIAFYEKKQLEAEQKKDSARLSMYQNELFDKKMILEKLVKDLEKNHPDYYRLKYDNTVPSVKEVQARIPEKSALLEYFVGDSAVFVFTLTNSEFHVAQLEKPHDFDALHNNFRRGLTDYNLLINDPGRSDSLYASSAVRLYDLLLKKSLAKLPSAVNRLLIVPDGKLGYLPFESLLTAAPQTSDYRNYPYLMNKYSIGYAFSASVWTENTQSTKRKETKRLFAGFAPDYKKTYYADADTLAEQRPTAMLVRSGALPLPNAEKEVSFLADLLNGDLYTGQSATESAFKARAQDYKILHLALHSLTDDKHPQYSRMLFTPDSTEDGYLNASELYNMRLNAELAVLSSCETGYGEVIKGEGIACLSRAFAYAGVPSITASYWKVPDASTSSLMKSFYENLKSGSTKDAALRDAKLNYLSSTSDPLFTHPYFWAAFVPVGDMKPVQMSKNNSFIWLITGFLILIISTVCFSVIRMKR